MIRIETTPPLVHPIVSWWTSCGSLEGGATNDVAPVRPAAPWIVDSIEYLLERLLGPRKRVGDLVPLVDECEDLLLEVCEVGKVGCPQSLAL